MKISNSKLLFISFIILFLLACEDEVQNCDLYNGRGNLISYNLITEYNEEVFQILINDVYGFDPNEFNIQFDVKVYRVVYESLGTSGEPTQLSGAIYVPQLKKQMPLPTLKISHYTITQRAAVASISPNVSPQSLLGSMQGYYAIYSDGIGYGVSLEQASYVNKKASAISGIDLLRASKEFACEKNIELNNQIFTTGYSAGGYGSMAFHQIIEKEYSDEFTITANSPGAGPYSLYEMGKRIFSDNVYNTPYYLGFALWGYMLGTGDKDALKRWVKPKYRDAILNMYDGTYSGSQIDNALNDTMSVLLEPKFLSDFLGDGEIEFKDYLKENSFIYDGWKPNAPIHFMHGEKDSTVFHFLMKLGADQLIKNGSTDIKTTSYPGDHGGAAADCMINSIKWFNTMRQ